MPSRTWPSVCRRRPSGQTIYATALEDGFGLLERQVREAQNEEGTAALQEGRAEAAALLRD